MSLLRDIEPIKTKDFLKEKFKDYYKDAEITLPPRFSSREWGFLDWNGRGMIRHLKFGSSKEIGIYLEGRAPAHCYHSVAYYTDPGKNTMLEKEWKGADLIFDLDADHLPEMDDLKAGKITFAQLMEYIKEQTLRLVNDVLLGDFALKEDDLLIVFSGGRGYHIHVRDRRLLDLPSGARRELADYLTTSGIKQNLILDDEGEIVKKYGKEWYQERYTLPDKDAPGWKGLVSRKIHNYIEEISEEPEEMWKDWKKLLRIGDNEAKKIVKGSNTKETFNILFPTQKDRLVKRALKDITVLPDEPVTGDIHRLIRLPGSLHGGTGLLVKTLNKDELEKFDPYTIPIVFSDKPIKIRSIMSHPVQMGNEFKLKREEITELPEYAAIYFMARKFATLCLDT
jgi:DNA primase small subunit